jgi:hypothetical protein
LAWAIRRRRGSSHSIGNGVSNSIGFGNSVGVSFGSSNSVGVGNSVGFRRPLRRPM